MGDKVLIIGASGFIGQNVTNYFKKRGSIITTYDKFKSQSGDYNYSGDLSEEDRLVEIVPERGTIIYLLASGFQREFNSEPAKCYEKDILCLTKILEACKANEVKRVIYASSGGTIYGENPGKCSEEDTISPQSHYAILKSTCENILKMYNRLYGMENISLRISNPYGIGQKTSSGVGVVTAFINSILNDKEITLFGNGDSTRDFIDIESVASAFYLANKYLFKNDIDPIFNIGSGEGFSLIEILNIISEALEKNVNIKFLPPRDFDLKRNVLDINKAIEHLNYRVLHDQESAIKEYVKRLRIEKG